MDELQVFNYCTNEVRTVQRDGEPWFVLADVCKVLDLTTPAKVAERLDEDEKDMSLIHTLGGNQNMTIINESGLYAVILRSDKPEAKPFRKWVTSEVLPAIRKTGTYTARGPWEQSVQEAVRSVRTVRAAMEAQGVAEETILKAVKDISKGYDVELPEIVLNPKALTLDDTFDMIDFIYSHERGRGHRKPTIEDFLIYRSTIKALES